MQVSRTSTRVLGHSIETGQGSEPPKAWCFCPHQPVSLAVLRVKLIQHDVLGREFITFCFSSKEGAQRGALGRGEGAEGKRLLKRRKGLSKAL